MKKYEHYMKNNEYYKKLRILLNHGYAGIDTIDNMMGRIEKGFDEDFNKHPIVFIKDFVEKWWKKEYIMYCSQFTLDVTFKEPFEDEDMYKGYARDSKTELKHAEKRAKTGNLLFVNKHGLQWEYC